MSQLIERDLLDVEVPVIDEVPPAVDNKGNKQGGGDGQCQKEGLLGTAFGLLELMCHG